MSGDDSPIDAARSTLDAFEEILIQGLERQIDPHEAVTLALSQMRQLRKELDRVATEIGGAR